MDINDVHQQMQDAYKLLALRSRSGKVSWMRLNVDETCSRMSLWTTKSLFKTAPRECSRYRGVLRVDYRGRIPHLGSRIRI